MESLELLCLHVLRGMTVRHKDREEENGVTKWYVCIKGETMRSMMAPRQKESHGREGEGTRSRRSLSLVDNLTFQPRCKLTIRQQSVDTIKQITTIITSVKRRGIEDMQRYHKVDLSCQEVEVAKELGEPWITQRRGREDRRGRGDCCNCS